MIGSTHDGEVLNAARKAEEARLTIGLTWGELFGGHQIVRDLMITVDNLRAAIATLQQENHDLRSDLISTEEQLETLIQQLVPKKEEEPDIEEMCEFLLDECDLPEGVSEFVESIRTQYRRRRRLSDKQLEALKRVYARNNQ